VAATRANPTRRKSHESHCITDTPETASASGVRPEPGHCRGHDRPVTVPARARVARAGARRAQSGAQLLRNIKAAGYDAADIDMVLLTHIHGDHSGGLTVQGGMMFPNADIYVDRHDTDYWLNPDNAKKAPEKDRHVFEQAHQSLDPYAKAGQLKPFTSGARILPGIRAVAQPGHTPGHTRYLVESDGHRLVLWGDVVHAEEVQFGRPDVAIQFDVVAAKAAQARKQVFDEAAREGYLVGGAHIPFPGLGHVQRAGKDYRWLPVAYSLEGLKP
jgi:glyoxylase-like metal-dependent hydrolase (beta-lactamase superfamily II)